MKRSMKGLICLMLCLGMAMSAAGCSQPAPSASPSASAPVQATDAPKQPEETAAAGLSFTPGTYTGEAEGFHGAVKVEVKVDESSITEVNVVEHTETEGIGTVAVEKLPATIVDAQSLAVDTVAGCTLTSKAILEGAKAALSTSGVDMDALMAAPKQAEAKPATQETLETQVAVIGAGGAGMTAAIKLREAGLEVLVIEKMPFVGGATAMSSSSALAQGTRVQKDQGVEDSPELAMQDLLTVGDFKNDLTPTWLLSKYSGATIDWLNDDMGVLFNESVGGPSGEYSVGRARTSVTNSGAGLSQELRAKMEEMGAKLMLETEAYELTDTNGVVDGVLAKGADGTEYTIKANAVLLATGGYCYDDNYIDASLKSLPNSGSKANTGDGIKMALPYGAVLQNMDMVAVAGHGIRKGESAQHTKPGCMVAYRSTGTILVNQDGERFVSETGRDAAIVAQMRQQERSFMVMDAAAFKTYSEGNVAKKYYSQEELDQWLTENGTGVTVIGHGDTLADAAARVGMDADKLAATVAKYNESVAAGEDKDFGRTVSIPMGDGPYYLVEQCLRYSTTLGGLTINEDLQIVNQLDQAVPGLYAAGELIGGVFGANFPPSAGVGWALTSGMLAGSAIAEDISAK